MTERLGTKATHKTYNHMFADNVHEEADRLHYKWLTAKYDRIVTLDILAIIDKANGAIQKYSELYNDLAFLHGVGIDGGHIRLVESPVIQLAALLNGEPITLAGREDQTAGGAEPLQARLFVSEPTSHYSEQAFNCITVELTDPNTTDHITIVSTIEDSMNDLPGRRTAYKYMTVDAANVLRNYVVDQRFLASSSIDQEHFHGYKKFNKDSDVRTTTTEVYKQLMKLSTPGVESAVVRKLHDNVDGYAEVLNDSGEKLLNHIGLLEWLVTSAKDGDLNPHTVERMEGMNIPDPSTLPDEYTLVFDDGGPIVIPIEHIEPFKNEPADPEQEIAAEQKFTPVIRRGSLFGRG